MELTKATTPDKNERKVMNNQFDELTKSMAQSVTRRAVLAVLVTGCFLICPAEAGVFHVTGAMNAARYSHTSTLLPDGKVLVVGGYDTNDVGLVSAELYNPVTGAWTMTGLLNTARGSHTATLLPNGKVLIAGGDTDYRISTPIAGAELYDPATGTWAVTGAMYSPRTGHTATLLPSGKVLVAGGDIAGAELYDPATGIWTETGALNESRLTHTATLLGDGKVLVATGGDNTAEIYDPVIGTWTSTGDLEDGRFSATATLLPNGRVLIVGGLWGSESIFARGSVESYNPADGTWALWEYPTPGSLKTARGQHTATLLFNGRVLVTGGSGSFFAAFPTAKAEEYDPVTGVWQQTGNMTEVRNSHTATLLANGQVLIAGGDNFTGGTSAAELYDADPSTFPIPVSTMLTDLKLLPNGSVQFAFTNTPGAVFNVLATTTPMLPLNYWMVLGGVEEMSPGQFQYTDSQTTNYASRFYRLRSP
jgi:WD40 repeat protein